MQALEPVLILYAPATHAVHALMEFEENCPAAHSVHDFAPVELSVSVTDPAGHALQASVALVP